MFEFAPCFRFHYLFRVLRFCSRTVHPRYRMTDDRKIYVVDDDAHIRDSTRMLLESAGFVVQGYASANQFLADRITKGACLITDIHMPAMSGLELYRRLIDTGQTIATILVTAFPNEVDRTRALNDGALCYLRKPVDEEHLTRCVREALSSAGSPEQE